YGGPQAPPQPTASPGPSATNAKPPRPYAQRPLPGGPSTPLQSQVAPQPGSPHARPTPPPSQQQRDGYGGSVRGPPEPSSDLSRIEVGNELSTLDPETIPLSMKREGADWYAVFNPRVRRVLDVDLIYEVESGKQVCFLEDRSVRDEGDLYIRSVCFSPNGQYLATGAEDKLIRVWDIASRTIRHQFAGHEQDIYSLDFASDGRHIASGSGDKTVRLWDIQNDQSVLTLHIEDGVTTVAISPDNRYVAAGSLDKSVRVWDTTTGYLVERLEGPGAARSVTSTFISMTKLL
ncbi:hypothetical protein LTR28_002916, partial [Elasticomyces elasticus]